MSILVFNRDLGRITQRALDAMWPVHTALAWDSNPPVPLPNPDTHSRITNWAIDNLVQQFPALNELHQYRTDVVAGASKTEMHELQLSQVQQSVGNPYGLNLEVLRVQHQGTNRGTDDISGWWEEADNAYTAGQRNRAYFFLGVMLHMVEDMGVPAHANGIDHQAPQVSNPLAYDNLEFMAFSNWQPDFSPANIDQHDPGHLDPSLYYWVSQAWTQADAPNYLNRNSFSQTWTFASTAERALLSKRQACTCHVVMWTLKSAMRWFTTPH
jgi:hypothetical protein